MAKGYCIMIDCKGCNAPCCKNVAKMIALVDKSALPEIVKEEYRKFPYAIFEDGSCSRLKDNRCSIYEHRPTVCSRVELHKKFHSHIPFKEFDTLGELGCESLRKIHN